MRTGSILKYADFIGVSSFQRKNSWKIADMNGLIKTMAYPVYFVNTFSGGSSSEVIWLTFKAFGPTPPHNPLPASLRRSELPSVAPEILHGGSRRQYCLRRQYIGSRVPF